MDFPTGVEVTVRDGAWGTVASDLGWPGDFGWRDGNLSDYLRPVCYQDFPAGMLPEALQDGNPLQVWRLVEGKLLPA